MINSSDEGHVHYIEIFVFPSTHFVYLLKDIQGTTHTLLTTPAATDSEDRASGR